MGLFVCDECNTVENTALGHYWAIEPGDFKDASKNGKALCTACMPTTYADGSPTGHGAWHGKFPRRKWNGVTAVMNR